MKLALKRFTDASGYRIYCALAGVLKENRPWIHKSMFMPDLKRRKKSRKQRKAKRKANKKQEAKGTLSTQTMHEFVRNIQINKD